MFDLHKVCDTLLHCLMVNNSQSTCKPPSPIHPPNLPCAPQLGAQYEGL